MMAQELKVKVLKKFIKSIDLDELKIICKDDTYWNTEDKWIEVIEHSDGFTQVSTFTNPNELYEWCFKDVDYKSIKEISKKFSNWWKKEKK